MPHMLAFGMPGTFEWIIILGIGLLLFGKRLPEIARGAGRSIVEFKKGMRNIEEEDLETPKLTDSGRPTTNSNQMTSNQ